MKSGGMQKGQSRQMQLVIPFIFLILVSIWWFSIYFRGLVDSSENNMFTLVYPWMSLYGAIAGFIVSRSWGGLKSVIGKAISGFSLGLFFQFFGQASYAYYIYIEGIDIPYPSLGDIGFFGSIIFYGYAILQLGKATGASVSMKSYAGKIQALLIPAVLLLFSYMYFLREYEFDASNKLGVLLDFGYPLGQAIYLSFAILVYILSRKKLGGMMRRPSLYLLLALIWQYCCDYTFLYQVYHETWYVGGVNDYMYFISYFLMTGALLSVGKAFRKIIDS